MTYQIIFAPRSRRDLEEIRAYIIAESGSLDAASRFLDQLFETCEGLKMFPARFALYPHARSWRMMPFESYLIFFEVRGDAVRIGHVRHGARMPFTD